MSLLVLIVFLAIASNVHASTAEALDGAWPNQARPPELDARVKRFPDAYSGSARCGPYSVEWSNPTSPGEAALTVWDQYDRLVVDVREPVEACCERISPFWCGKALDDHSMVLDYGYYTGGAHCCTTEHVVDLDGPRTLLRRDLGNYNEGLIATQLDDSSSLELFGLSDIFSYFDDLSYAASPFLPMVFGYRNQTYREVTRSYEDLVRSDLRSVLADLRAALEERPSYFQELASLTIHAFGDYVLLDETTDGLERLKSELSAGNRDDVASWLGEHASEAVRLIEDAFARLYGIQADSRTSGRHHEGARVRVPPPRPECKLPRQQISFS